MTVLWLEEILGGFHSGEIPKRLELPVEVLAQFVFVAFLFVLGSCGL